MRDESGVWREWDRRALTLTYDFGEVKSVLVFDEVVAAGRTKFQEYAIVCHRRFGRCLILDEDVVSAEHEAAYDAAAECLVREVAGDVLVLGGGDDSMARLLERRRDVKSVTVVEVDEEELRVCREVLGCWSGLTRTKVVVEEAAEFLRSHRGKFDTVVDDLPAEPFGWDGRYWPISEAGARQVVSQTEGLVFGKSHARMLSQIREAGVDVETEARYCALFLEPWTFTRWRPR